MVSFHNNFKNTIVYKKFFDVIKKIFPIPLSSMHFVNIRVLQDLNFIERQSAK